ncbi:MAG TPA: efflux transporter outer membrane subunit [Mizugakiibacter sp.]|nr:efflux transporter outer membrane subunit [Mizugakiibacter sp.]
MRTLPITTVALVLLLTGCAGLPPKAHAPKLRQSAPLAGIPTSSHASWPTANWWQQFYDPQLDHLIIEALQHSPNMAATSARVQAALAAARATGAALGPQVGASIQMARQRLSNNGLIPPQLLGFNWYNQTDIGTQLRYEFDFWGKHRATIAAATDQARAAAAEHTAARMLLSSGVAATYFGWQADQARLHDLLQVVKTQQAIMAIAHARVQQGLDPNDRLNQARAQLAGLRVQLAGLRGLAAIQKAALAGLVGVAPAQLESLTARPLPHTHTALPADAHLNLVARRADITALRWQVEAASENLKVTQADFYPNFSLNALAGFSSIKTSKILDLGSRVFNIAPAIQLPIFDSRLLRARFGYSQAQLDAAAAAYNQAVINAAQQVATAVLDLHRLHTQRQAQQVAIQASKALLHNAQSRFRQGLTDRQPLLQAKIIWLQQRDADTVLQGQALAAHITLIRALGGGFNSAHPPSSSMPVKDSKS